MELPSMVERTGDKLVVRSLVSGSAVFQTADEKQPAPMELPSMVERTGDKLVVRSLVSGSAVFQTADEKQPATAHRLSQHALVDGELLERKLQRYPTPVAPALPATISNIMRLNVAENSQTLAASEELPQCKIRRNYSCTQCAFFTQNPRSHLSHLRDVHGERIIINECKLCLYASRHYQKLVRHMKMVHGCVDDTEALQHGGGGGRRNGNREVRKRRLEESVEPANLSLMLQNGPSLEQLKCELQAQEQQLMHNVQIFTRQQELQKLQKIVAKNNNIYSMAFEFQSLLQTQRQRQLPSNAKPEQQSSSDSDVSPPRASNSPAAVNSPLPALQPVADTQYCCSKCAYSTPVKARFKKHVKYHSMPLIKCNACDFHTPYKWNLDRHTKNHGANRHFRCSACNFSTDIKQSLTIHELNHHVPTVGIQIANARRLQQHSLESVTSQEDRTAADKPLAGIVNLFDEQQKDSAATGSQLLAELAPIHCTHCETMVANAVELLKHLQQCAPALHNTSLHFQAALGIDMDVETSAAAAVAAADDDYASLSDLSYCGVETAPGYGEVTEQLSPEDTLALASLKKVFKCPHCTFWAATASRFHVHIVGHLNRKPFECSLCAYRSNWRWDITKHIRLKTMRDKSHSHAKVLMNDETGRRNYAKYNQYLTMMKVNSESGLDAKAMRSGELSNSEQITAPADKIEVKPPVQCEATTASAATSIIEIENSSMFEDQLPTEDGLAAHDAVEDDSCGVKDVQSSSESSMDMIHATSGVAVIEFGSESSLDNYEMPIDLTTALVIDSSKSKDADSSFKDSESCCSLPAALEEGHNATFRCGLCHQSSNWKHVIQRHSRLKHGGLLCIETLINNVYQKIDKEEPAAEELPPTEEHANEGNNCERKHHASHKQTSHKCEKCEFACSVKTKLAKHVRLCHTNVAAATVAVAAESTAHAPLPEANNDAVQLAHCPHCPARFVQQSAQDEQFQHDINRHLAAHNTIIDGVQRYGCRYCCYYTDNDAQLEEHMMVHGQHYQLQCQQRFGSYTINSQYPAPMMTQIMLDTSNEPQAIWVVVRDPLDHYDMANYYL